MIKSHRITEEEFKHIPRDKFANKGNFGAALLLCGSEGMIGAAVLAAGGALRSGCGLVTVMVPEKYSSVIYSTHPSAMVVSRIPDDLSKYTAIGCGCGIGKSPESVEMVEKVLSLSKPMILDADALNILSLNPGLQKLIPPNSILTPHIGELKRLVGEWSSEEDKVSRVTELAQRLNIYIVVKGAETTIFTPDENCYVNYTGNPGMAKGGSGDILTGFMTGILAKGTPPLEAAKAAVFYHGAAGDRAAISFGEESMNSLDILNEIKI